MYIQQFQVLFWTEKPIKNWDGENHMMIIMQQTSPLLNWIS